MDRTESMELLDSAYTVEILLDLLENPGLNKTELLSLRSAGNRTRYNRIGDLIRLGLIIVKPARHNMMHLYLSVEAQEIALKLRQARDLLEKIPYVPADKPKNGTDDEASKPQ